MSRMSLRNQSATRHIVIVSLEKVLNLGMRKDKLADELRDILASCFQAGNINDPRLAGVTITKVKLTADLMLASVYYRLYKPEEQEIAHEGLQHCKGYLRNKIAQATSLRRVPELRFFFDESIEKQEEIERLLAKARE